MLKRKRLRRLKRRRSKRWSKTEDEGILLIPKNLWIRCGKKDVGEETDLKNKSRHLSLTRKENAEMIKLFGDEDSSYKTKQREFYLEELLNTQQKIKVITAKLKKNPELKDKTDLKKQLSDAKKELPFLTIAINSPERALKERRKKAIKREYSCLPECLHSCLHEKKTL